ncbi:MAG TPA: thiolase family protein [Frankiaceae bacterium]|jgi:acetyl-CoA acetyltransferase|nr:thiolase family protein [Frankiaceae bacterium]
MSAPAGRRAAIAGLGITEVGKVYGRSAAQFAADAVRLAAADAGLSVSDIDGLLVSSGVTGGVSIGLQQALGLTDLALLSQMQAYGATAGAMVTTACMAVQSGMAEVVACVFGDAPLTEGRRTGAAYGGGRNAPGGWRGMMSAAGINGANSMYALAARRHMLTFGTTSEQFAHIAVAQREWAMANPQAQMRTPMTIEDHQSSRWVAEPFHLFDCCLVSNGGVAVIVTSAERAASLQQPPVHVLGWGQSHPGHSLRRSDDFGLVTGAKRSSATAFSMAGLTVRDIDVFELYDCYTYTVLVSLEDYGLCAKGEGGPLAASGALSRNGSVKVNTGGGQLSGYYLWGMTPMSEGIIQARGQGGERQVERHDVVLVSGNGGVLDHHSTTLLSGHAP